MENIKKYIIISLTDISLLIPIFCGLFQQFLKITEINIIIILLLILLFFLFLGFGKWLTKFGFDEDSLRLMKSHDATASILARSNKTILYFFFPLTMLMEELFFRFYLVGFFVYFLEFNSFLTITLSSVAFSIYHIHFWFRFRNIRITVIYVMSSFFLGLYLSYILFTLGLVFSVISHFLIALFLYNSLAKKINKELN